MSSLAKVFAQNGVSWLEHERKVSVGATHPVNQNPRPEAGSTSSRSRRMEMRAPLALTSSSSSPSSGPDVFSSVVATSSTPGGRGGAVTSGGGGGPSSSTFLGAGRVTATGSTAMAMARNRTVLARATVAAPLIASMSIGAEYPLGASSHCDTDHIRPLMSPVGSA